MSFPRYASYKPSGVEWLGDVPDHWSVVPVKSVATIVNGYPFNSERFCTERGYPLIRIRDLGATSAEVLYDGEFISSAAVTANDVLIGMDGDFNVGRWRGEGIALLNQRVCCVRGYSDLLTRFLEYALPHPLKTLNDVTYSTTVKHLSSFDVQKIRISLPPSAEELRPIITVLDRETAKVDVLVDEQKRLIELLKEKRQAVISHAVTKGLDPSVPMKDSGVEWLGEIPAHWTVKRLKFVARVQSGVPKGRDLAHRETIEVPYLRVANVQDGYLDLNEVATISIEASELERYSLRPGDVLMNEGGDFDKLGRGHIWRGEIDPCIHQNHVFAVRTHGIEPEWLNLVTSAECGRFFFMSRSKQSTNLASISSTNLQELPICCPPAVERRRIIEYVGRATAELNKLAAEAEMGITFLRERRSALISAAVTGKIDVRGLVGSEAEAA